MPRGNRGREVASTLPGNWWHDEGYRERIYDQIRACQVEQLTAAEIAVRVGVSKRTVHRVRSRMREIAE